MSRPPASDVKRNPLIPIGCAVFAVLMIPPFIYSIGPEGPIKKDHVVFSTGNHRAYFQDDARYQALRVSRVLYPSAARPVSGCRKCRSPF